MPPKYIFDISGLDLNTVVYDQEAIRVFNPQRGDMEHLNGIVYVDEAASRLVGFKDVRADEFWVAGHLPGRPLLPGVLMIEAAAQASSFYTRKFLRWQGFVGFGGVDEVRFRQPVAPGCRLYLLTEKIWERHGRVCCCNAQGIVDGNLVFEAKITGVRF